MLITGNLPCADPEIFISRGPTLTTFFFFFLGGGGGGVDEGRKNPNTCTTISGMAFSWQADDGPTLNAGLVAL